MDTSIFKAYDIRGIFPTTLNENIAYKIAQGYAEYVKPQAPVVVGNDVRLHSVEIKNAIIRGLNDAGIDTVDVGLITTDMLYFCVGSFGYGGGIQATASHNPPEWHGIKMIREKVIPLNLEEGINQIKDFVVQGKTINVANKGKNATRDIENEYCQFILGFLTQKNIKPMKIVIDPNFGYSGKIFEKIIELGNLPIELIKLNFEPDGTFPKGRPDPFIPENRIEFMDLVKNSEADLGIAWDADGDRVFFCADGGEFTEPYYLNTILIKQMLADHPREKIIYDPRYTWALIEAIKNAGGEALLCRVGHSYIKEMMRKDNALFATESSGHTYYRDYFFADCGMIPPMQVINFLSSNNVKLSDSVKPVMNKYFISGEINTEVVDKEAKMNEIAEKYKDGQQSRLDGIAIEYQEYRFCVRPSNTENLLRLTLEAKSKELMEEKRDEVLRLIRS
ncbi:MAG TPA: phosphomannomutase/phosphoglucomutase [Patescibacteria group bacterium]|nr:phosphomannomutase/phosphoglucomutase [Patescibacteria group bacterium]